MYLTTINKLDDIFHLFLYLNESFIQKLHNNLDKLWEIYRRYGTFFSKDDFETLNIFWNSISKIDIDYLSKNCIFPTNIDKFKECFKRLKKNDY